MSGIFQWCGQTREDDARVKYVSTVNGRKKLGYNLKHAYHQSKSIPVPHQRINASTTTTTVTSTDDPYP
jgi:hypothetical protein